MRSAKILLAAITLIGSHGPARAQIALGSYGQLRLQAENPTGAASFGRIFGKTSDGLPYWVKPDGSVVAVSAGGGGTSTLAGAYSTGASQADNTFFYTLAKGYLLIKDNAAPIGTLLEIQKFDGTSYFKFNATSMVFGANKGVTAVAGTGSVDLSNMSGLFKTPTGAVTLGPGAVSITGVLGANLSVGSGFDFTFVGGASDIDASASSGVWKSPTGQFSANGHIVLASGKNISAVSGTSGTLALPWTAEYANQWISPGTVDAGSFLGNVADGVSAVAWDFNTANPLTATAKILRVRNNAVEVAAFGVSALTLANGYGLAGAASATNTTGLKVSGAPADGASSVGVKIGSTSNLVNATAKPVSFIDNDAEFANFSQPFGAGNWQLRAASTSFGLWNSNNDGYNMTSGNLKAYVAGTAVTEWTSDHFAAGGDLAFTSGTGGQRWTTTYTRHLAGGQGAAPTCAIGSGAGTTGSPTCSLLSGSTDLSGTVRVTTTTTMDDTAVVVTVTYNTAYGQAPHCQLDGASADGASKYGLFVKQSAATTTTMPVYNAPAEGGAPGLGNATVYDLHYTCTE